MAHKNVSFKEAARIKKSNIINSAFSYSNKLFINNHKGANNFNSVQEPDVRSPINISSVSSFPPIFHTKRKVKKISNKKFNFSFHARNHLSPTLVNTTVSSLNGSYLEYASNNNCSKIFALEWITSLASTLTHTITNSMNISSSPSALSSLIESTIINLFMNIKRRTTTKYSKIF